MDLIDKKANYEPFPSAIHALLFMLVNSPRPIVCTLSNVVVAYSSFSRAKLIFTLYFTCAER